MDAITPSYVAKANRAEKHLIDLEAEIGRYAARKPYTVRTAIQGEKQREVRRLVFTASPGNTDIPIILADAIYNLRSALEHLMGALHPRSSRTKVTFPIFFKGVWDTGPEGENAEITGIPRHAVDVEVQGTPAILIRTGRKGGDIEIPSELVECVKMVRAITDRLVPYVRV